MSETLILVVDDEPDVRLQVSEILTWHGFHVIEAGGGTSALTLLQAFNGTIGLVISDYRMPGMDGAALARQVKEQFPDVPVLIVSGEACASDCAVADGFLAKPFAPDVLVDAVRRLVRLKGAAGSP